MKLKKHERYEIEWVDIQHQTDWVSFDELQKNLPVIKTLGYFIEERKDMYIFAGGYSNERDYYTVDKYPKSVVKKIRKI